MIYIFSGPVQSGKTTRLMHWIRERENADGILAPVIGGYRHLYHIGEDEKKLLEVEKEEANTETMRIGKYVFSNEAFCWAQRILDGCAEKATDWIIVDEIGPLELKGKGLEPAVKRLIGRHRNTQHVHLVLVVRENLVDQVCTHYDIMPVKFSLELE